MRTKEPANQFAREEVAALKDKECGKSYCLSDFTFVPKKSPMYRKDFKEFVVSFLYKNEEIKYYCFVNAKLNREEALNAAKKQISNLIKDGGITLYAKKYYQKTHN